MVHNAPKTCPAVYRLIDGARVGQIIEFMSQKEFERLEWLPAHLQRVRTVEGKSPGLEMLAKEPKHRLEPLDREAGRVHRMAEDRGQYALDGLAQAKLSGTELDAFKSQPDALSRSLWAYCSKRMVFEAAENVLHHRMYRNFAKHYQTFPLEPRQDSGGPPLVSDEAVESFLKEIEERIDLGTGCTVERFALPEMDGEPDADMYILYHPNPLTSVREIEEKGERRTLYYRPPGEATIVHVPSTGMVSIRADTKILRKHVANGFASQIVRGKVSSEPRDQRAYDLSRFFEGFTLDGPEIDGFHVRKASVIRAEISLGRFSNRLSLTTARNGDLDELIAGYSGLQTAFRGATAVHLVEILVDYVRQGESEVRSLDFTISDQNSSSLLSLEEESERRLGRRLLKHWEILREFRRPDDDECRALLPLLIELWDSGLETLPGSWLLDRGIEPETLTETGFLVPTGWEDIDLIDDGDRVSMEASIHVENARAAGQIGHGQEVPLTAGRRYRRYQVNAKWIIEFARKSLAGVLDEPLVEVLSPDIISLGRLNIEDGSIPVYLARRLRDPSVLAASDLIVRHRGGHGLGLVLSAAVVPFRCLVTNVLVPLADHLAGEANDDVLVDRRTLATAFRNGRSLALGGTTVELVWDGGETGELYVPKKPSLQIPGRSRLLILRRLVDAFKSGAPAVKTGELTKELDHSSLQNAFGPAHWRRLSDGYVRHCGRGSWAIDA